MNTLPLMGLIGFFVFSFFLYHYVNRLHKLISNLCLWKKRMSLYMEVLIASESNPLLRDIIRKISFVPDGELSGMDVQTMLTEESIKLLCELKTKLNSDKELELGRRIDDVINLMSTIDNNSSAEFKEHICNEIFSCLEKLDKNIP